ncbi:MAG: DUF92 domain-containing protein, partial [Anaerolineales bacterium]
MIPWGALLWGVVLSTASGIIAHRRGSLAPTGVAGAVLVGTLLFGYGGIAGGTLLVAFFVSSSVLSR